MFRQSSFSNFQLNRRRHEVHPKSRVCRASRFTIIKVKSWMHTRRLVKLPVHRRRRAKGKSSSHIIEPSQPKHCKISRGHHAIAGGVLLVAIVLISLSLNHLTNGIAIMTDVGQQSSWVMAGKKPSMPLPPISALRIIRNLQGSRTRRRWLRRRLRFLGCQCGVSSAQSPIFMTRTLYMAVSSDRSSSAMLVPAALVCSAAHGRAYSRPFWPRATHVDINLDGTQFAEHEPLPQANQ